jgi:hypothetical protein
MKLIGTEYAANGAPGFYMMSDTVMLRGHETFIIPEFATRVSCVPQLFYRVRKIGKGILPRNAHRYVREVGAAVHFYADNLIDEAHSLSLLSMNGAAFDQSVAVSSPWEDLADDPIYTFEVNGAQLFSARPSELPLSHEQRIVQISNYFLLKLGDYLLCGNTFRYNPRPGDFIRMSIDDLDVLHFYVR